MTTTDKHWSDMGDGDHDVLIEQPPPSHPCTCYNYSLTEDEKKKNPRQEKNIYKNDCLRYNLALFLGFFILFVIPIYVSFEALRPLYR